MAKILTFKQPDPAQEFETILRGEAVCAACKHEWSPGQPVGTVEFPCPNCGRTTGVFKTGVVNDTVWRCNCGCHLFTLTPDEILCWSCGTPVIMGQE